MIQLHPLLILKSLFIQNNYATTLMKFPYYDYVCCQFLHQHAKQGLKKNKNKNKLLFNPMQPITQYSVSNEIVILINCKR